MSCRSLEPPVTTTLCCFATSPHFRTTFPICLHSCTYNIIFQFFYCSRCEIAVPFRNRYVGRGASKVQEGVVAGEPVQLESKHKRLLTKWGCTRGQWQYETFWQRRIGGGAPTTANPMGRCGDRHVSVWCMCIDASRSLQAFCAFTLLPSTSMGPIFVKCCHTGNTNFYL